MIHIRITTFFSVFCILLLASVRAQEATFEGLGDLAGGEFQSEAYAVSGDGSVVVGYATSDVGQQAYRWENGVMESLGDFPGGLTRSRAEDVSFDGSVITGFGFVEEGREAFRWVEETGMVGIGDLPGSDYLSWAYAISNDGSVIVGVSNSENGTEAFRWEAEADTMIGLGAFPDAPVFSSGGADLSADGAVVVGYSIGEKGTEAARWENGELVGLGTLRDSPFFHSQAYGISADGSVIVGFSWIEEGGAEAVRWADGELESLGDLPGGLVSAGAYSVSADGSVVVGDSFTDEGQVAMIWTEADGMRDLSEVLVEDYGLDLTGWTLHLAWDISADGTIIVGRGTNPNGDWEAWRAFLGTPLANESDPDAAAAVLSVPSPNPVRGSATFTVAAQASQDVTVEIFDAMGRRIKTLYEGILVGGVSKTLVLDASTYPAGVYVIRATGETFSASRRVTVIR